MITNSYLRRSCLFAMTTVVIALFARAAVTQTPIPPPRLKTAAPLYAVSDLGTLPSLADDVSVSLNASGQVALWVEAPDRTVQAALWTHGQVRLLGSIPGCPNSVTCGISDTGEIIGWANTSANVVDSLSTTRAFVYRQGHFYLLGTLGGRDSRPIAVNSAGQVAGVSDISGGGRHAFLSNGHSLVDLGTLPGGRFSEAYALNDQGQVAGVSDTSRPYKHAALWRGGHAVDLGTLPGGTTSSAQAINNRDQVAGFADTPDGTHAFLYTGGKMQDLGTLGDDPSKACALNSKGQIVGTSGVASDTSHAFLWQNKRMVDLNSLVSTQWVLTLASGINERGQIVCIGLRKGSASEAAHVLLLTPLVAKTQTVKTQGSKP